MEMNTRKYEETTKYEKWAMAQAEFVFFFLEKSLRQWIVQNSRYVHRKIFAIYN